MVEKSGRGEVKLLLAVTAILALVSQGVFAQSAGIGAGADDLHPVGVIGAAQVTPLIFDATGSNMITDGSNTNAITP